MKNILTKLKDFDKKETSNFILFFIGKFISVFGTSIYTFAIGLYVLKITGSGLSFATTMAFGIIPVVVFGPFAGVIADKFDKKKIIIIMDALNGVLFMALFFITSINEITLTMIYLSTFISTTLTTIFSTSFEAAKPNLVSDDRLINLNSSSRIIDSISSILGPVIGGVIFALIDLKLFMIFNSISFLFSAFLEGFIDFDYNRIIDEEVKSKKVNFKKDIVDGIKFIFRRQDIKTMLGVLIAINFFLGISVTVPLPYIINNVLKLSASQFGIIEGMFPFGIIIGALLVKKVLSKHSHETLMFFTSIMLSICTILLGVPLVINLAFSNTMYLIYYTIVLAIFGVTISLVDIPIIYKLQKTVSDEYRGRVLSIGISIGKVIQPLAFILSGLLLNIIFPAIVIFVGGGLMLVTTTLILKLNKTSFD